MLLHPHVHQNMDKFVLSRYLYLPLITLLLLSFCHGAFGKSVIVTLPGHEVEWQGAVADFGYQFDQLTSHPANLMLAPEDDPFLCSYPSSLHNELPPVQNETTPSCTHLSMPIALLISHGRCSFETKVEVALALHKNFTRDIQYIIIYNNERDKPSQLIRMTVHEDLDLPHLGFLTVSTEAGSYMINNILYYAQVTQLNPYLGANETDWDYLIVMEQEFQKPPYTFYMILFSMLILAPCFHALHLCWTGVVHIEYRRNGRGHITGLRIVRTIPSSLGEQSRRKHLLTAQQVCDLPEITYTKKDSESVDDVSLESCEVTVESQESHQAAALEPTVLVRIMDGLPDEEMGRIGPDDESSHSSPVEALPENVTTSSSCCSICIDDFQNGERIRVLPKCRHAFHTDCLMPWLTERQGCCPTCKRRVLESDEYEDGPIVEETRHAEQDVEQQGHQAGEGNEIRDQASSSIG